MMQFSSSILDVLTEGPKLNFRAGTHTADLNESHLLVHGVIARALEDRSRLPTSDDLDLELTLSVGRWQLAKAARATALL
ncbi:MAG: hypothetical protein ABUS48_01200 [Pseudomonadota bacterium]